MEIIPPEANPGARRIHSARVNYRMPSKTEATQEKNCPYCTDISNAGKLRNMISGMRGEGNSEVHTFRQEFLKSIQSGTFSASEVAENAPDPIKARAEKTGVGLEESLNQWEDKAAAINKKYSIMPNIHNPVDRPHFHCHLDGVRTAQNHQNFMGSMSEEGKAELQTFKQEVRQAVLDGTFNAVDMAENAPAELKAWAEEFGIDLVDKLTKWTENVAESLKHYMWRMSDEGKAALQTVKQEVRQAVLDGTFNAAEMAENAPAELKAWAEEFGIDLVDKLDKLAERTAKIGEKFSSEPENTDDEWPADSLLEHIMIDYLALELENTILGMSEEDKTEMQTLGQEIHQAIQDGTFNAAELAEKVPPELMLWSAENGVDLEEALKQWADKIVEIDETPPTSADSSDEA